MEKEMIQNYAVENSVNVGGKRFLFCISTDENEPHPYMKCSERRENFLAQYENAIAGNDYLEVMKLYVKDISDAIAELENERIALGVENADCLKPEELIPIGVDDDIRGKVVALHERELIDGCKDKYRIVLEDAVGNVSEYSFEILWKMPAVAIVLIVIAALGVVGTVVWLVISKKRKDEYYN